MKKFFLWLLIAALFVALTGCKGNQQQLDGTNNTLNTKASQNTTTENKEIENTKNTESQQNPATEATENNNTLNTESQQNPPTEAKKLEKDGSYTDVAFRKTGDGVYEFDASADPMYPLIILIK